MKLAKVIGTVVSSVKDPSIDNLKILVIQPLDDDQNPTDDPIAAIDMAQAGPDALVYYILSRESSLALPEPFAPVDATITGIVDHVHQEDRGILDKKEIFQEE